MSKCPWPQTLTRITRSSPACFAASASSNAARSACEGSGAGMIPSLRAKVIAASKALVWLIATASTSPSLTRAESPGASPW